MLTLYQQQDSGNCYKVRLVLSHLGRPFRKVAVSSLDGSTRRPEFLAKNPIGKLPTIELEDGRFLAECDPAAFRRGDAAVAGQRVRSRQSV
jgi:glutathione S-transferase